MLAPFSILPLQGIREEIILLVSHKLRWNYLQDIWMFGRQRETSLELGKRYGMELQGIWLRKADTIS